MSKEMKSLGRIDSDSSAAIAQQNFPTTTIERERLPGLAEHKFGDTFIMKIKVRIQSISKYGDGDMNYGLDLEKGMIDKE